MRRVVPLLIVLSLGFAPAPVYRGKPDSAKDDLVAMQGKWNAVTYKRQFKTKDGILLVDCPNMQLTITGGLLKFSQNDRAAEQASFKLDRSRSPRAIDAGSGDGGSCVMSGIYKLEGDTLTICDAPAGVGRPSDFAGDKPLQRLIVLKRVKK